MAKFNLLIANAGNYFSDVYVEKIKKAAKDAELYFIKEYDFNYDVDIAVTPPSCLLMTIPEDGIGGRTYSSRLIVIVLNQDEAAITYETVFEMICHEMAHSLRWEKLPEHATTLFDGMIMEGLAVALEEKALNDNGIISYQYFLKTILETSTEINEAALKHLEDMLIDTNYDYETIFFSGDSFLPRWAGYRIGYMIVKRYIKEKNITIKEATLLSHADFEKAIPRNQPPYC